MLATKQFRTYISGGLALGLLFAVAISELRAQTASSSTVLGIVTDPTGAVVPEAEVQLRNLATNAASAKLTNSVGQYVFPGVTPGRYTLVVRKTGFAAGAVSAITVDVAKSYNIDVVLQLGAASQTVEVTTARGELQTTDAEIGNVIGSEPLLRLPSVQRSAIEFLTLQPGVTPSSIGSTQQFSMNSGASVSGARSDQTTITLDGIDITDNIVGGEGFKAAVPVPVDSVEEFRVGVSNPNATFSRASGGQVSLFGRHGTNAFHGAAFWYHQNDNLNANSWTNNRLGIPEAETKDNRFGARLGGPLWRDKSFFGSSGESVGKCAPQRWG
ncbi:MAG: carboxypeptidase regulatory-like domain-containing protein [Bryobacteraceae bacterium]